MNKRSQTVAAHKLKVRLSVSFSKEQHDLLAKLAADNNVSICWVVRHACDLLVDSHDKNIPLHGLKSDGVS